MKELPDISTPQTVSLCARGVTSQVDRHGMAMIELPVTLLIVGVLGLVVVPQWSSAAQADAQARSDDIRRYLQTQVNVYATQHSAPIGYIDGNSKSAFDADLMIAQLTRYTDVTGRVADRRSTDDPYGMYLDAWPSNPVTGGRGLHLDTANADNSREMCGKGFDCG